MIFEVCVDSVEGAIAARQGGAQRVELCDNLVEGGTTPSLGAIRLACRQGIAVNVLVRPRGGDFVYSDLEMEIMRQDILAAREAGANGVVIGVLQPDGTIDAARTRGLAELARPMSVTFHRAFDLCREAGAALETLIGQGIDRLLTSGLQASALAGADCIAALVRQAAGRIVVMAGGGVNAENLPALLAATRAPEVHFSARRLRASAMQFRHPGVFMGKAYQPDEYSLKATDPEAVRQVITSTH